MKAHPQSNHCIPVEHLPTIEVQPLEWSEWDSYGYTRCGSIHSSGLHHLREMGKTSNGYEYAMLVKPEYMKYSLKILKLVLRPTCCKGMGRCPIGKKAIPNHPCREHLREEAKKMAYEAWVQYLSTLAGK
jgi:hypothetical protein